VPAADLAAKPVSVGHLQAAAVPLGALTAWQALHEHAQLASGQHVLVHGGGASAEEAAVHIVADDQEG
jgi:NADPH:quinone reductase-like Zn-dependent oxidoreductase